MTAPTDFLAALVAPLLALALGLGACAALLLLWAVPGPRASDPRRPPRRWRPPPAPAISSPLKVPVLFYAANGHCVLRWAELVSDAGDERTLFNQEQKPG